MNIQHGHSQQHSYMYTGQPVLAKTSLQSCQAHRSAVATPLKDHQPHPLRMHTNVFVGLKQVRIIEVPEAIYRLAIFFLLVFAGLTLNCLDHACKSSLNTDLLYFRTHSAMLQSFSIGSHLHIDILVYSVARLIA